MAAGVLALGSALAADEPVYEPLTLKGVIALALQNNADIKVNDLGKVIEGEKIKAALQAFDLQLDGGYIYQAIDSPQNAQDYVATGGGLANLSGSPRIFEQRNHTAKVALAKKLETGMTLEFGTTTRSLDNTLNRQLPPSLYNPEWETFTGLTLTQPLLRGWGAAANTAEIRIAKANARMADLEWQSRTAQVVAEVMRRYYDVVFTLENMKVQQEAIGLAQKLMDDTTARSKEGVAAGNDVVVAEAGVYQRMEDALTAEMEYIERQNSLQLLFKTVDDVIAQGSRIQPVDGLGTVVPAIHRASLMATAQERRYEILQSNESIVAKSAQVDYATSQARPRLDLVASGGYHGLEGDLGGSYGKAADGQGPEWTAGVQFSVPLNWDHMQAIRRAAEDQRTQAFVQRGDTRLRVALEVDTALARLRTNEQRLGATKKSREAAAQSAEGGMKRLIEGVTTSFEVLQLQKDYSQARSREYAALAELNKNIVDLYLASGTLLERQGITLQSDVAATRKQYDEKPEAVIAVGDGKDSGVLDEEIEPSAPAAKRSLHSKSKRN
jgi:outer membrane protein TolC